MVGTKPRPGRSHLMDLEKRQDLLRIVGLAAGKNGFVAIEHKDGRLIISRSDLVCYENHVEGTDRDGGIFSVAYSDIDRVGLSVEERPAARR